MDSAAARYSQDDLAKCSSLRKWFERRRTAEARICAPDVAPGTLDALLRSILWPDVELPWAPAIGVSISGEIEPVGIYRSKPIEAEVTIDDLLRAAPGWHDELEAMRQPPSEQVEAIIAKSKKEQDLKILGPWMQRSHFDLKYGAKGWRALKDSQSGSRIPTTGE